MALWRRHLTGWQPVHQCCFPSLPAVECGRLDGQGKYIMRALQAGHTSGSAVAERPRDASCLSVSFNSTIRRAQFSIRPIGYFGLRLTAGYN